MRWIQTGLQLGQAVKNVQRLRQIVSVFSKYGFVDVVDRMRLGRFLPSRLAAFAASQADKSPAERIRLAFEELGPTFVKLGQLLSTRPDLLPENFIEELVKLQDNVPPMPFEMARGVIERELGRPLGACFREFREKPLAAASIGQAHEAWLASGEHVVVKVQRPEIERIISTDISLLAFLASMLEKYVPESRILGPKTIVDEFFRTLNYELDFVVEAANMNKIAENMRDTPEIVIPRVFKALTTRKVLTLEKLEGIPGNDLKALEAAGVDRKRVVDIGARAFFKSVMIDGLFHGDLHGGNLFILPGNRIGIIDFGIVGRLSQKSRDQLASMVMSLLSEDYENLCYQYAELGAVGPSIDFDGFQREVRNTLSPYLGLALAEINLGRVLIDATQIAARYSIKVPGDWMIVFKAILTLEGMGRSLDPSFDLLAVGQELVKELVKNQYSPQRISKDLLWVAKDMATLLQALPRQVRWMFRKLERNDFALEFRSPELAGIRQQLDINGKRANYGMVSSSLFIAGAIALHYSSDQTVAGYPLTAVLLFVLAGFFLIASLLKRYRETE